MINSIDDYIADLMVPVPKGMELIRRFNDKAKWISSDSRMCIPSKGHNQLQTIANVEINPFEIAKYSVTNQLYELITKEGRTGELINNSPKVNVSWYDAIMFCNAISRYTGLTEYYSLADNGMNVQLKPESKGFRLPTDAEWQYACKAGSNSYQYSNIDDIAWYNTNSDNRVHSVGEKQPNAMGLYDTLGNVWEWCWDLYDEETYGSYRIFRGGSFEEDERSCGSTTRRKSHPEFAIDDLGFRIAKSI